MLKLTIRNFLVHIMVWLLLLPSMSKYFVIGWWQANQTQIAKTLCENRFDISVMCFGKCYLIKELNKLNHNDGSRAPLTDFMNKIFDVIPEHILFRSSGNFKISILDDSDFSYKLLIDSGFLNMPFIPPDASIYDKYSIV